MHQESRVEKTLLNARVNLIFYFLTLVLSFFSRKIFLENLGADFVGLTGSLGSLLGFLNLVELGIGSVVGFSLYKPIFDQDRETIKEIVSVFGYLYRWVGLVILCCGLILSCFFPLIFPDTGFDLKIIYFAFFSFLFSSVIGYFVNYRQTLLAADQRSYVVTAYFQSAAILKTLVQMVLAYYTGNYYLWAAIEFVYGLSYALILNWKINQVYPWLKTDVRLGKQLIKKYPVIFVKIKQIFVHKIAGVVYSQSAPILIYAFATLETVAFYGNYTIITSKLGSLLSGVLGSTAASVGNLIAEGNKDRLMNIYWELLAIRFWIAGIFSFALYKLLPPFIKLWLGNEYLLSNDILILVIISFVLGIIRNVTDQYKEGCGLFADVWAPIVESIISIMISISLGYIWGLKGVLLGGIISTIIVVYGWQPYYLFTEGLFVPYRNYIFNFVKNSLVLLCCYIASDRVTRCISIACDKSWMVWVLYAICVVTIFSIISFILMLIFLPGMRAFVKRILSRINHEHIIH